MQFLPKIRNVRDRMDSFLDWRLILSTGIEMVLHKIYHILTNVPLTGQESGRI
jgi:hypothetical protein